ncbi:Hypothetical predicted protein [Mytilus galloprovincialis]|uniref:Uncharacterized protein n=1 Tax=Mytilus galloprovincialis TaxID=29158 RepID=A0A8B6DJ99_MYTGA|nr:Hypothetical predicted protein [Mytilus galloprovincialis]
MLKVKHLRCVIQLTIAFSEVKHGSHKKALEFRGYDSIKAYCDQTINKHLVSIIRNITNSGQEAEYSNYSQIPLNEHRSQQYLPAEVHPDETYTSSIYHKEDGDKQPSPTLLDNQHFAKPELYSEGDQPPPYTSVEQICVVTDTSQTYKNVPVLVNQSTSSDSLSIKGFLLQRQR